MTETFNSNLTNKEGLSNIANKIFHHTKASAELSAIEHDILLNKIDCSLQHGKTKLEGYIIPTKKIRNIIKNLKGEYITGYCLYDTSFYIKKENVTHVIKNVFINYLKFNQQNTTIVE